MSFQYHELPWLPAPPADFSAQCRSYGASESAAGPQAQHLAGFRLTANQSNSLARAIARRRKAGHDFAPLSPFRLGILANATMDLVVDCIPAGAARHGIVLDLMTTPYDQVIQQAIDPVSTINTSQLDAVLLSLDHRWMQLDRPALSSSGPERVAAAIGRLRAVVDGLKTHSSATPILQTLPTPPLAYFGSFERRIGGSLRKMIADANLRIVELAQETGSYLLDVEALADRIGTDRWFDPVQWHAYKLPFAAENGPAYAEMLGRLLGAIRGKARKCLVLDLDNTIWGGVIGDDGLGGIKLGYGSASGEAFQSLQQVAAELRERGIILAVCSKNTDEVARRPFREHPDMVLKEGHIAVFQANWLDKPSNLEAIARTLNIGLDALVFLDDNPAERAQVRASLPMVAVPEIPSDPSWYSLYLLSAGYFEAVAFSAEDGLRAQSYASDAQRADVLAKSRDLGDYLTSLEMTLRISPFDAHGRQRITQLINKTNQFNLTTRRYTETEVTAMETDNISYTQQVRLEDKFGNLGMIAVVICRPRKERPKLVWEIDSWLMSCRVLGRKVEEAMLGQLVKAAAAGGASEIIGTYIPTAKNDMVSDHYGKLGFSLVDETAAGTRTFSLKVADYREPALPMKIVLS